MDIGNLIRKLFWVGLALGWSGTLVEVTNQLKAESARSYARGLMSIGQWNRALLGQPKK